MNKTKVQKIPIGYGSKRGSDAALDHQLVIGKLKQILRWFVDNNARTKYNVDYLKERDHPVKYKQD